MKSLFHAISDIIRGTTAQRQADIRLERVEQVLRDGRIVIQGTPLSPVGRMQTFAGDLVHVEYYDGAPRRVLGHAWQRAQMAGRLDDETKLVEVLFIATVSGTTDIYFRNAEQVVRLQLDKQLMQGPTAVRWGDDGRYFAVAGHANAGGPRTYQVYQLTNRVKSRAFGTIRPVAKLVSTFSMDVSNGMELFSMTLNVTEAITRYVNVRQRETGEGPGWFASPVGNKTGTISRTYRLQQSQVGQAGFPVTVSDFGVNAAGDLVLAIHVLVNINDNSAYTSTSGTRYFIVSAEFVEPYGHVHWFADPQGLLSVPISSQFIEEHVFLINATQSAILYRTARASSSLTLAATAVSFKDTFVPRVLDQFTGQDWTLGSFENPTHTDAISTSSLITLNAWTTYLESGISFLAAPSQEIHSNVITTLTRWRVFEPVLHITETSTNESVTFHNRYGISSLRLIKGGGVVFIVQPRTFHPGNIMSTGTSQLWHRNAQGVMTKILNLDSQIHAVPQIITARQDLVLWQGHAGVFLSVQKDGSWTTHQLGSSFTSVSRFTARPIRPLIPGIYATAEQDRRFVLGTLVTYDTDPATLPENPLLAGQGSLKNLPTGITPVAPDWYGVKET